MRRSSYAAVLFGGLCGAALFGGSAVADEPPVYTLSLQDHRFDQPELKVPAGQRIKLVVKNLDAAAEEFESHDLKIEKIVAAGKEITVSVGPLKPGRYEFVGEFHEDTAKGVLVVE